MGNSSGSEWRDRRDSSGVNRGTEGRVTAVGVNGGTEGRGNSSGSEWRDGVTAVGVNRGTEGQHNTTGRHIKFILWNDK